MPLEKQLSDSVTDQIYDVLRSRLPQANAALKSATPPYRDMRDQAFVFLKADSDENVANLLMVCDPKQPDVLIIGSGKFAGEPYANGVDLANVSNGPRKGKPYKTKRKKPLATFGWWETAIRAAAKEITGG